MPMLYTLMISSHLKFLRCIQFQKCNRKFYDIFGSLLIQFIIFFIIYSVRSFLQEIYMEKKSTLEMKRSCDHHLWFLVFLTHFSSSFNIFSWSRFASLLIIFSSSSRASSSCYVFIIFYALLQFSILALSHRSTMMHNLIERTGKKTLFKRSLNIIYIWSSSIWRLNWDINDRKGSKRSLSMLRIN